MALCLSMWWGLDLNRCSVNQLWVPICDRLPQVGVKKAVHPIRFASDSRIALLAVVVNPPHDAALSWGCIIFVGRKCGLISSRQNGLTAPPERASSGKNLREGLRQRGMRPASGPLTVNYFATSPGESTLPQAASSADARRWGLDDGL